MTCKECGAELEVNTIKIMEQEVFCPNEACPLFVQSFWVERESSK
jgi:hypothetical protein